MEPIHYLRVLRRRWWVIVASILAAAAAAWLTTTSVAPSTASTTTATYSATTVLWDPGVATAGQGSPITNMDTLEQVTTLPDVAAIAARIIHYQGSPLSLRTQVQASADQTSGFLNITGFGANAKTAESISDAFSHALIKYLKVLKTKRIDQQQRLLLQQINTLKSQGTDPAVIALLQTSLSQLALDRTTPISLTPIQKARAEPIPVQGFRPPRSRLSRVLLASLIGLLAGLALALVLERFDTKLRTRQATESSFGLPVLAEVPLIRRRRRKRVVTAAYPTSRAADAFRLLSVAIARWTPDGAAGGTGKDAASPSPPKTVLVTSPGPREGKTTVVANLAAAYAEIGNRVLVLSCDLRRPAVHRVFHVADRPGLTEVLKATNDASDSAFPRLDLSPYVGLSSVARVAVLPSGAMPERPGELLGSARMRQFIERASEVADVVILDCAPLLVASDVVPLLPQADAVVIVARAGRTPGELAGRTANLLARLGAKVVGVVLNDASDFALPLPRRRFYRPKSRGRASKAASTPKKSRPEPRQAPQPEPQWQGPPQGRPWQEPPYPGWQGQPPQWQGPLPPQDPSRQWSQPQWQGQPQAQWQEQGQAQGQAQWQGQGQPEWQGPPQQQWQGPPQQQRWQQPDWPQPRWQLPQPHQPDPEDRYAQPDRWGRRDPRPDPQNGQQSRPPGPEEPDAGPERGRRSEPHPDLWTRRD